MPSKSKSQQRFFGMVDAYKKGELKHASKSIKDAADSMTTKQVKDFAETKHKGLPNKVKKHKIKESYGIYGDGDYFGNDSWSSYDDRDMELAQEQDVIGRMVKVSINDEKVIKDPISLSEYNKLCKGKGFRFVTNSNFIGGYFVDKHGNAYKFLPSSNNKRTIKESELRSIIRDIIKEEFNNNAINFAQQQRKKN